MQPSNEKPKDYGPKFIKADEPTYDYRNMEKAGQYRGVGHPGKVGHFHSTGIDAMPPEPKKSRVRRDHEG